MPNVISGTVKIHYRASQEGIPLVIIPGLAMDYTPWEKLTAGLDGFHLVLVDNRDSGQSSVALGEYTPRDMSADIVAVLDDLGLGSAHILGHSLGGQIAQELCLSHPDRVRSLALVNSWARTDGYLANRMRVWQLLKRHLSDAAFREVMTFDLTHRNVHLKVSLDDLLAMTSGLFSFQEIDSFCRGARAVARADTMDRLHGIACPALVVWGDEDVVLPSQVRELRRSVSDPISDHDRAQKLNAGRTDGDQPACGPAAFERRLHHQ